MSLSNIKISCSESINNLEPLDPCITKRHTSLFTSWILR
nr:MAG TPA: hypothetical protein [Caudoviricetes sp.]